MTSSTRIAAQARSELLGILLVLAAGLSLVGAAGFAGSDVLHAIAHDGRHAAAFPCH